MEEGENIASFILLGTTLLLIIVATLIIYTLYYQRKNLLLKNSNFYVSERISFEQYKRILSSSKFTFCPKGNGLSSYRFFESFHLNSIPVLIADNVILPYVDKINYTDFIVRIKESDCNNLDYIINRLNGIEYDIMLQKLNDVREMFTLKGVQEEVYNRLSL